jgi:hypothetical protein
MSDLIVNRIEVRIDNITSTVILVPVNAPVVIDLIALFGCVICLIGVGLNYRRLLIRAPSLRIAWLTQGIGFIIVAGAYIFWVYDFFNLAGAFG